MDDELMAYNLPISTSHTQREKLVKTKNTIKNPSFFDIDKISNDYINIHNKMFFHFSLNVTLN